ncbi:hypothetical protein TRFO_43059 [Tritrichomonas foetus]|uniref:SCP domain-containing protein n=1 Tax=Tritrichomonas foetus TaxID=1144522 RepID=A0A1J4KSX6_9EUKA|nr:hypothetical protein TRFO_43059 [Tritrichomonas foetus]|eukprot:OHT14399.1 hypothetical protein TRFO_43059 [Tritrichomonas foetus]
MHLRKLKQQIEKQVLAIFPSVPKINITAYIHHHPSLSAVDFIVHFLEIAEPTKKSLDLQTDLLIAQARQVIQHKKEEEETLKKASLPISEKEQNKRAELQKIITTFEINDNNRKFSFRLFQALTKIRMQKKRARFQDEDYLTRLAFAYAYELKAAYKTLDSDDWKKWLESHPDFHLLTDANFCCGFVPQVGDTLHSILSMLQNDKDMKQIVFSSARFCGIGIAMTKSGSVFFTMFVTNRK